MTTVTASELRKNFGRYQAHAQRGAIKVTSHGRESVVLLSAEDYERLKALDDRADIALPDIGGGWRDSAASDGPWPY